MADRISTTAMRGGVSILRDYDPEADYPDSENESDGSANNDRVSKTSGFKYDYTFGQPNEFRRGEPAALGPTYRGKRASRAELEESDDEGAEDDEEEEEEEEDDDEDKYISTSKNSLALRPATKRKKGRTGDDEDEEEDTSEEEVDEESQEDGMQGGAKVGGDSDDDDDDDEEEIDESDESDENDENEGFTDNQLVSHRKQTNAEAEARAQKALADSQKQFLAPLEESAKTEAAKGFAIQQQRRTFDAILNMRIRLQKALASANTLHVAAKEGKEGKEEGDDDDDDGNSNGNDTTAASTTGMALESAEEKTLALLSSIQELRESLYGQAGDGNKLSASKKRKAKALGLPDLFDDMAKTERTAVAKRRRVLEQWAKRRQRATTTVGSRLGGRIGSAASPSSVSGRDSATEKLDLLLAPDRKAHLVKRTRTPRSCAPVQAARKWGEDTEVFDDADFYQLLLRELVEQRVAVEGNAATAGDRGSLPTVRWAADAAKDAKVRKEVDRRASKGRKMRFNVHEKLVGFMTPDPRGNWEKGEIDRFFNTLLGQRLVLDEEDSEDEGEDVPNLF